MDQDTQHHMHSKADCCGREKHTEQPCCHRRPAPRYSHECHCRSLFVGRNSHDEDLGDVFQTPDDDWKTSVHRSSASLLVEHHQHLKYAKFIICCELHRDKMWPNRIHYIYQFMFCSTNLVFQNYSTLDSSPRQAGCVNIKLSTRHRCQSIKQTQIDI